MLRPDQPIPDCTDTLHELARIADNNGDALTARLFAHIAELQLSVDDLTHKLEKIEAEAAESADASYWSGYEDGKNAP